MAFFFLWSIGLLTSLPLFSQVTFSTKVPKMKVTENEMFQITFQLKNARGYNFEGPDFKNFTVLSKPSRYLDSTKVSLNADGDAIYSYALFPKDTGTFRIPPARVMVNGRKISSNTMLIQVYTAGTVLRPELSKEEAFVRTEVSAREVFLGQQLVIDYKLYSTVNVQTYYFTSEPSYKGFYKKDTHHFNSTLSTSRINGIPYQSKILKRVILFPQQQGRHTIEPMYIRLGIVGDNLFKIDRFNVSTEPMEIIVKPLSLLSSDIPIGAVGQFQMEATISDTSVNAGKDIRLRVNLTGNGDIKAIKAPDLNLPNQFETYPPRILEEGFRENRSGVSGKKTFEYVIIPKREGRYTIAPQFNYFDTDSSKLITLSPQTFLLEVSGNVVNKPDQIAQISGLKPEDILGLKTRTKFYPRGRNFMGSNLFYLLLFFPFLMLAGAFVYREKQKKEEQISPDLRKKLEAKKIADKHLQRATELMARENPRDFYNEISRAALSYVSNRLNIPPSTLTKNKVKEKLQVLGLDHQTISDLLSVLTVTEHILYTGSEERKDMDEVYHKAKQLIEVIEVRVKDLVF